MTDRATLTVSHYAHCILQMKSFASQEDHIFSVISTDCWKNIPARFPAKESNHAQCWEWNPALNFWSWSLSVSEWSTVVLVGTCYPLIQIFGHFILSECTSSNTATSVSCETTKLLDAWLFTGGTPSYLPPHERPPDGLSLYLGWATQFEWHRWNRHHLKSSCQLVSVVWVARTTSALFILGWVIVSHLAGRGMTRLLDLKARPACRRDLIKNKNKKNKLSAKSPNTAACWAPASQ